MQCRNAAVAYPALQFPLLGGLPLINPLTRQKEFSLCLRQGSPLHRIEMGEKEIWRRRKQASFDENCASEDFKGCFQFLINCHTSLRGYEGLNPYRKILHILRMNVRVHEYWVLQMARVQIIVSAIF